MTDIRNIKIGDESIVIVPKDAPQTYNLIRMWEGERVQVTALKALQGRPFAFHDPITNTYLDAIPVELRGIMNFNVPPECLMGVMPTVSDETRAIQLQGVIDETFSILSAADDWDALDKALTLLSRYMHTKPLEALSNDADEDWTAAEENDLIGDQDALGDDTTDFDKYNPLGI